MPGTEASANGHSRKLNPDAEPWSGINIGDQSPEMMFTGRPDGAMPLMDYANGNGKGAGGPPPYMAPTSPGQIPLPVQPEHHLQAWHQPAGQVPFHVQEQPQQQQQQSRPKKYKTEYCKYWQEGICQRGEECLFAHSPEEMRGGQPQQFIDQRAAYPQNGGGQWGMPFEHHHGKGMNGGWGKGGPGLADQWWNPQIPGGPGGPPGGPQTPGGPAGKGFGPGPFPYQPGYQHQNGQDDGQSDVKYKTEMCKYFQMGTCKRGRDCTFAHSMFELRQDPGGGQGTGERLSEEDERRRQEQAGAELKNMLLKDQDESRPSKYKTELCKYFLLGTCKRASECTFAHNQNELHNAPPEMMYEKAKTNSDGKLSPQRPEQSKKYKTELCKFWGQGACKRGTECTFVHSVTERKVDYDGAEEDMTVKFTEMCKYHPEGTCKRGEECPYAHTSLELGAPVSSRLKENEGIIGMFQSPLLMACAGTSPLGMPSLMSLTPLASGASPLLGPSMTSPLLGPFVSPLMGPMNDPSPAGMRSRLRSGSDYSNTVMNTPACQFAATPTPTPGIGPSVPPGGGFKLSPLVNFVPENPHNEDGDDVELNVEGGLNNFHLPDGVLD